MYELPVEHSGRVAMSAVVNSAIAAAREAGVEVVSDSPGRVELLVPGVMKAVSSAERILAPLLAGIPTPEREAIAAAFREILGNAIEHGCRLDPSKRVEVSLERLDRSVVCRVKDPGEGFDPERLDHAAVNNPEGDPIRHVRVREVRGMRPGGFGLLLAAKRVDELLYGGRCNEVTFIKYLS